MKVFIVSLLMLLSFCDGVNSQTPTSTATVPVPVTTSSTITATITATVTTITATTVTSSVTTTSSTPTISTASTTTTSTASTTTGTTQSSSTTTAIPTTTTQTDSPAAAVSVNVTWTFASATNVTNVVMVVKNLKVSQWAAIGLGQNQSMGEAHVFMCQHLPGDTVALNRFINPSGYSFPRPAGPEEGGALTVIQQSYTDGVVICEFSLSNFTTQTFGRLKQLRRLSQSGSYYPLFAIGPLDDDSYPAKHYDDSRVANSDTVQLNQNENILYKIDKPGSSSPKYFQAHGIIMVFAWILFASTGIIITRYFKTSWSNIVICGEAAWFAAHRLLLSIATVLTILGFLFILVALGGKWVDPSEEIKHYLHSIFGAIVISFAFFQPFIALFRCKPDSRYRFIYNYVHAFLGFSALLLSIATLFLSSYFQLFKHNTARVVIIIWTVWLVLIFAVYEFIQRRSQSKESDVHYSNINVSNRTIGDVVETPLSSNVTLTRSHNEQGATSTDKLKNILLALHILVASIAAIVMSTQIA